MIKTLSGENIEVINFKFNQVYKINLSQHDSASIIIKATIEGENSEHIVLTNRKYNNALFISSDFQPAFNDANDKLSAHKVLSIALNISIPKNKTIYLKSDIANVTAIGHYKKLTLELLQGNCNVSNFTGNALINTIKGAIARQTDFATVTAETTHGQTYLEDITSGDHSIVLNSVNGDITLTKSQE